MISTCEQPSSSQPQPVDCAILSAMTEELAVLKDNLKTLKRESFAIGALSFEIFELEGYRILLTPTGVGTGFATIITTLVHAHFNPQCMLFMGTAGAIENGLGIRDIILVESAFEAEAQGMFTALANTPFESCLTHPLTQQKILPVYSAHKDLLAIAATLSAPVHRGTVVTSNVFPAPKGTFPALRASGALAIDMETSAFYQATTFLQIPSLAIRVVSNKLDNEGNDKDIGSSDIPGSVQVASDYVMQLLKALLQQKKSEAAIPASESALRILTS